MKTAHSRVKGVTGGAVSQGTRVYDPSSGGMAVFDVQSGLVRLSGGINANAYAPQPGTGVKPVTLPPASVALYNRVRARVVRIARDKFGAGLRETSRPFM